MKTPTRTPKCLPREWRERAEVLRVHGAPDQARLVEHLATELDQVLAAGGDEALTLVQAASECNYSSAYLGCLIKRGVIVNSGRPGSPRIRRSDLPTKKVGKPGRPPKAKAESDATKIANAFREREEV